VHRTVCQQDQDGGADVPALSSPVTAATAARAATEAEASAGIETEAAATGTEAAEPGLETGAERAVAVSVDAVLTDVIAKVATGLPPLLVKGSPLLRVKPEPETARLWCVWVVHGESPNFPEESAPCASDTSTIYRKLS
jgi:hypothetical protein